MRAFVEPTVAYSDKELLRAARVVMAKAVRSGVVPSPVIEAMVDSSHATVNPAPAAPEAPIL